MLLEDVFIINNLKVLNEGKAGPMKIGGTFQRADEENNNKRIYPKSLLMREVTKLEEAMKNRRLMGELDHPKQDSVSLSNVSHLVTSLKMEGNELVGEAEILNTPMGKVAQALIEGGVQIGISSRGMGTLSEGQDGKRYVNEDFRLVTWDIVADPSTRGAFPALSESVSNVNSLLVEEIMGEVLPRVTEQKVFSTLLRESLAEAMDDFDKATLKADEKARKTGEKAKLPKWKDYAPKGKISQVIDTSTPEGKKKAAALAKSPVKEASRNDSSTELFRGLRARLSEMETPYAMQKRKRLEALKQAEKLSKVTLPKPKKPSTRKKKRSENSSTEIFRGLRSRLSEYGGKWSVGGEGNTARDKARRMAYTTVDVAKDKKVTWTVGGVTMNSKQYDSYRKNGKPPTKKK